MSILQSLFGKKKSSYVTNIPEACDIIIQNEFDAQLSLDPLTKLGFNPPQIIRMIGLIPIACGRIMFQNGDMESVFPPYYIVTNDGRSNIKVEFAKCEIYNGIISFLNNRTDHLVAIIGPQSCEVQAINHLLNKSDATEDNVNFEEINLYPPELLY